MLLLQGWASNHEPQKVTLPGKEKKMMDAARRPSSFLSRWRQVQSPVSSGSGSVNQVRLKNVSGRINTR
jgi:hypothetical protein